VWGDRKEGVKVMGLGVWERKVGRCGGKGNWRVCGGEVG